MNLDNGAVQGHRFELDAHDLLALQLFKDPIQDPGFGPAIHAGVDRVPVAKALGQTAPLAAPLGDEQDRVENLKIIQTDVASLNRQEGLDLGVLCRGDFHPRRLPITEAVARRKVELILGSFGSQAGKSWFTAETFRALLRLRGIEANAPEGLAEAYFAPKVCLSP